MQTAEDRAICAEFPRPTLPTGEETLGPIREMHVIGHGDTAAEVYLSVQPHPDCDRYLSQLWSSRGDYNSLLFASPTSASRHAADVFERQYQGHVCDDRCFNYASLESRLHHGRQRPKVEKRTFAAAPVALAAAVGFAAGLAAALVV